MIELVDTHAHLQEEEYDDDRQAVIQRAHAAGVRRIVVPAVDLETAVKAIALAESYEGMYSTAGFHPHEASKVTSSALAEIATLLDHPKVVAVGETGLDWYRMHSPREAQIEALKAHLDLAGERTLPVVIHCRDAWADLRPLIESWARRLVPAFKSRPLGVMHYFSSNLEDALFYQEIGFLISVHTSVTHPKARALRDVAAALPLDTLVIETDSPYGAPQAYRGKRNEPAYVVEAAKQIATLRHIELDAVAAATTANATRLFGLSLNRQNATAMGGKR